MTSKANERQIGGDHYKKGGEEHWDRAWRLKYDPFQYIITKWVERWRDKGGVEDLKKAQHAIEKYIELVDVKDKLYTRAELQEVMRHTGPETSIPDIENKDPNFTVEGWYGDMTQLYKCRRCGWQLRSQVIADAYAAHGQCPGREYVDQEGRC